MQREEMKLNEIVPLPHMEQSETHVTYYAMREKRHTKPTQSATHERKNGRNVNSITSASSAMLEEESESNNQGARVIKLPFQGFRSRDFQSSSVFRGARVLKQRFQGFRSCDFQSSSVFRGARVLKLPFQGSRPRDFRSKNIFSGSEGLKTAFSRISLA